MDNKIFKKSLFTVAMLSAGVGAGYASMRSNEELFTPTTKTLFSDEPKEVVFIAPDVKEYGEILSQLNKNIVIYQLGRVDTLGQMNSYLDRHRDIKAIHIISHGSDGELHLGDTKLESKNLDRYTKELKSLGEKLSKNGDILLYGCDVAKSAYGKKFVRELSNLTSADILASDDITASAKLQGDVELEFKFGDIESKPLLTQRVVDKIGYKLSATTPYFTEQTGEDNPLNSVSISGGDTAPTFVDIDNDGDFDAFIGEENGNINYYKNEGSNTSPTFTEQTGGDNPFDGVDVGDYSTPTFVDIDNDGDFDAFIGKDDGTIKYYKNEGTNTNPTFTEQTGEDNPLNSVDVSDSARPEFVDIDSDGDFDVFIADGDGTISHYENEGNNNNPTFVEKTGTDNPLDSVNVSNDSNIAFVDIDNDGDFDTFIGEGSGSIKYYRNALPDTTPDTFSFTALTNQEVSTLVTSNQIVVSGIDKDTPIDVSIAGVGCKYIIEQDIREKASYTDDNGTLYLTDKVTLQTTSSSIKGETTSCTLTIGGISDTFSVTTKDIPYVPTDVIVPIAGFQGDVIVPQTLTPVELTDGTNQFNVENKNSNINTIMNIPPETSDKKEVDITVKTNETDTKISAPKDAKFSLRTDGTFEASQTLNDGSNTKLLLRSDTSGNIEVSTVSPNGNAQTSTKVEIPSGSTTTMNQDGSVLSQSTMFNSDGSATLKVDISLTQGKAEAVVTSSLGEIIRVSNYDGSTESIMSFIKAKGIRATVSNNYYSGVKNTFKSTTSFFASKGSLSRATDYSDKKTVEIIPITAWQKFEEVTLFNGKRSITLILGGANIVIDGETTPMIKNEEYLLPLEIETLPQDGNSSEVIETKLNPIYENNSLKLTEGWSLISSPINRELDVIDIFKNNDISYKFQNSNWIKNPDKLLPNEGIWVKYNFNVDIDFNEYNTSSSYDFNSSKLTTGWNLVGTGNDITLNPNEFINIWAFDNINKNWVKNPNQILRGYGFWVK